MAIESKLKNNVKSAQFIQKLYPNKNKNLKKIVYIYVGDCTDNQIQKCFEFFEADIVKGIGIILSNNSDKSNAEIVS